MARTNSRPDLNAELTVSIERFPYKVFFGNRIVAHLFTSTLVEVTRHAFQHVREMNALKREYNYLVDVLKGRDTLEDPSTLKYQKLIPVTVAEDGDDFFKAYGVKLGQIWKTKGSHHHYKIVEIDQSQVEVMTKWIGPWKYTRSISIEQLKKRYELIENANEAFILAVTTAKEGRYE